MIKLLTGSETNSQFCSTSFDENSLNSYNQSESCLWCRFCLTNLHVTTLIAKNYVEKNISRKSKVTHNFALSSDLLLD